MSPTCRETNEMFEAFREERMREQAKLEFVTAIIAREISKHGVILSPDATSVARVVIDAVTHWTASHNRRERQKL